MATFWGESGRPLGVGSTKADVALAPRIRNWKESNALRRSPLGGKQGHGEFQVVERDWADLGWVAVFAPRVQGCQISVFSSVWRPRGLRTPHRVWTADPHLAVIQAGPTAWRRLKFVCTLICREGKPFRAEGVQQSGWQRGWQRLVLKCKYPRTISSENTAISNGIGRPADCRLPGPTATALMLDCRAACRDPSHHESDPVRGLGHPA